MSCLDCYVAESGSYVARSSSSSSSSSSREGSAGSASSTTSLSVGYTGLCRRAPRAAQKGGHQGAPPRTAQEPPPAAPPAGRAARIGGGGRPIVRRPQSPAPPAAAVRAGRACDFDGGAVTVATSRLRPPIREQRRHERDIATYKTKSSRRAPIIGWDPRRGSVHKPLLGHNAALSADPMRADPMRARQQAAAGAGSAVIMRAFTKRTRV